jgi:hypothetical protein
MPGRDRAGIRSCGNARLRSQNSVDGRCEITWATSLASQQRSRAGVYITALSSTSSSHSSEHVLPDRDGAVLYLPADQCALRTRLDHSTAIACASTSPFCMRSNQKVANNRRKGQPGKGDQGTPRVATSQVCNVRAPKRSRCRPAFSRPHLHLVAGRSRFFNNIITPL